MACVLRGQGGANLDDHTRKGEQRSPLQHSGTA